VHGLQHGCFENAIRRALGAFNHLAGSDGVKYALNYVAEQSLLSATTLRPPISPPRPVPKVLLTAIICAALYPQLTYVHMPKSKKGKPASSSTIRLHLRDPSSSDATDPVEAVVHPASVNSALGGLDWLSPFACYHDVCLTSKLFVRACSPVPPLAPFIFCGQRLEISDSASVAHRIATLDGWLRIKLPLEVVPVLTGLRTEIDALFQRMVEGSLGARGGGRAQGRRTAKDTPSAVDEQASIDALIASITALLYDAIVEPLPPKPIVKSQAKKGSKSAKTRKRKLARQRAKNKMVEKTPSKGKTTRAKVPVVEY